MNFDDALKRHLPRVWFGFKFIKYKYLGRGERELRLIGNFIGPGTTAIDIGTSIGMYSAEMARHAARVMAFEPNPAIAAFARAVVPRNVEIFNVALSSQPGRAVLSMPRNRKGHGVTELASIRHEAAAADDGISVEVETRRLDDYPVADCSFIKMDVEGHEEAVLDGADALIARERPVLMIELIEAYNPGVIERVTRRFAPSYTCCFLSRGELKPVTAFDPARDQRPDADAFVANFFFIPAERQARLRAVQR